MSIRDTDEKIADINIRRRFRKTNQKKTNYGSDMRATGKILEVTTQSVMRWIRKMYDKLITGKPDISAIREVEMDEMHHYHKKNLKSMDLENY